MPVWEPRYYSPASPTRPYHLARTQRVLGLDQIDQTVATYFGLTSADLHTSRKTRTIALARGIAMYLARKHTDMSFPEIGRFMGNKNHSTVILANRRIAKLLDQDEVTRRQTAAGLQEERLRDIILKIEKQLGKAPSESTTDESPRVPGLEIENACEPQYAMTSSRRPSPLAVG